MPSTDPHVPPSTTRDGDALEPTPPAAAGTWTSLERKLPLLISALLLLVVAAYGWATYVEVRGSSVRAGTEHLRIVAQQLADLSQSGGVLRNATLRRLAADPAVLAAIEGRDPRAAARALTASTSPADSGHAAWELWGADGVRHLALDAPSTPRDDAELRPVGAVSLRSDSIGHSPLYAEAGRIASWTTVPVRVGSRSVG